MQIFNHEILPGITLKGAGSFAAIICIIGLVIYSYGWTPKKDTAAQTIDAKVEQLKTLRAEKKAHEEAIYKINQKIIPLKCSVFSDVQAKEQWDYDCKQYFEAQQSKIQEQAQSLPQDTGGYTPEEQ